MLSDEHNIKHHAHVAQPKLHRIASQAAPVCLESGVNDELRERKHAANSIEKDLVNAPACCRFTLVVDKDLWAVLDECTDDLDIAECVDTAIVISHGKQ